MTDVQKVEVVANESSRVFSADNGLVPQIDSGLTQSNDFSFFLQLLRLASS